MTEEAARPVANRPLRQAAQAAGTVGRGTAAVARGTGRMVGGTFRTLWGPFVGAFLILAGLGVGVGATAFFMEFYEFDDEGRSRSAYIDQVQDDAAPFWWLGLGLVAIGASVIAADLIAKHMRDGMRLQSERRP